MRAKMAVATLAVCGLLCGGVSSARIVDDGYTAKAKAKATATATTSVRLREAAKQLKIAPERRAGYDRDKFRLWIDADGDCRDTRDEVLAQESRVRVAAGCDVVRGQWLSYYDGVTWVHSSDVDIDHLVPLAEAWDSGARRWTANTRQRYANDLGDRRTLVAVTDNVNQSKSDQDVHEWLPQRKVCRYVAEWVAVKTRWGLSVDRAERRTVVRLAGGCRNVVIQVDRARIRLRSGGGGGDTQPAGRVRIAKVVYDPPGTDTENAETATLVNHGRRGQLRGFTLRDSDGAAYTLPGYWLGRDQRVVVHSGVGRNRIGHLYARWGFTWNNAGDTARLLTPSGVLADVCRWGAGSGSTSC